MSDIQTDPATGPLNLNFLSHGTLESTDTEKSRRFYEEFLGFEIVRTSPISLLLRLGGNNTMAVVEVKSKEPMPMLNHNGLDVSTKADVDAAHAMAAANPRAALSGVDFPATAHYYCVSDGGADAVPLPDTRPRAAVDHGQ